MHQNAMFCNDLKCTFVPLSFLFSIEETRESGRKRQNDIFVASIWVARNEWAEVNEPDLNWKWSKKRYCH